MHTATASQLGQMLKKLAPTKGIAIINVVRRQEQKELLEHIGAQHIVVTNGDEDAWKAELKVRCRGGVLCPMSLRVAVAHRIMRDVPSAMVPRSR